jgi:hypothetical protein
MSAAHPTAGLVASLQYSAQPASSRVRVERGADGSVTVTILPMELREGVKLYLAIGSVMALLLLALLAYDRYRTPAALLSRLPVAAGRWAATWAATTAFFTAAGVFVNAALVQKTTVIRIRGNTLSVLCRRWFWRRGRQWPADSVRDVRVTWVDRPTLLDGAGEALFRFDVPDLADVAWLCVVLRQELGIAEI